jgi:hypothetical protein
LNGILTNTAVKSTVYRCIGNPRGCHRRDARLATGQSVSVPGYLPMGTSLRSSSTREFAPGFSSILRFQMWWFDDAVAATM